MSVTPRTYSSWINAQPSEPGSAALHWQDSPSFELIEEELRARTELREVGRRVFAGTLTVKNKLWLEYRNFVRQAVSNFDASRGVSNRSTGLLQYYALLNFAKAELLVKNSAAIYQKRIGHGLSFNPLKAKTVAGDALTVQSGVFPLLYEARTGVSLPTGTRLGVKRLLQQIPEIASQLDLVNYGDTVVRPLFASYASNESHSWVVLGIEGDAALDRTTQKVIDASFERTSAPIRWKSLFGLSPRWMGTLIFYQSKATVPLLSGGLFDTLPLNALIWGLRNVLGMQTDPACDGWLAPSFSRTRNFPMPPAMARYAVAFYASSLVRYRPSMFDAQVSPAQALLFDAIARETSLPMLQDSFSGLMGSWQFFSPTASLRA